MLATHCYSTNELESYLRGAADEETTDAIERHLRSCEVCEDTLADLDSADDTLIRTLRIRRDSSQPPPHWLDRISQLNPTAPTSSGPPAEQPIVAESPTGFGDYELIGTLGRGGMSIVFSARHKHLGRTVALKVLMPTSQHHELSRERFSREMRVVGGLTHPSIIRATDAGEYQDTLYLVMDQIDGVDLKQASRATGPMAIADVCEIGLQVARGLQHAHSLGVIHRDIKPSNIMIDRDGNVKILDFGLARVQSDHRDVTLQTTIGQLLGTLDYMAPEQANGSEVGEQADIYALGATLFRLLTGVPPHGRSADVPIIEFLNRLANESAPRVRSLRETVPESLCDLVASMLHRDPAERESSVENVADQIAHFVDDADLAALVSQVPRRLTSNVQEFLAVDENSSAEIPPRKSASTSRTNGGSSTGAVGWSSLALALASVIGIIWLAVAVTLKTPEGEFRIESDMVDNFTVELVDEDSRVDLIAVEQGKAATTIRAGRYRVRVDLPSNAVSVSPNEVIVSKDKTAIVKVSRLTPSPKSPAKAKTPVRDPSVAMAAQIELKAAVDALAEAKLQKSPDESTIQSLQKQIIHLRALTQPIPTEPVYKGRTLADWTAQMRYEQDREARETAAKGVLRLARGLPENEQLALTFEARARLESWQYYHMDVAIARAMQANSSTQGKLLAIYGTSDHQKVSNYVATQLVSDNPIFRNHALVTCIYLRHEIRKKQWPHLFEALQTLARSSGSTSPAIQLTHAVCHTEPAEASKELLKVDPQDASRDLLAAMLAVLTDERYKVDRATQIVWTATYILSPSSGGIYEFVGSNEFGGPLSNLDWDNINAQQQKDIDDVARRLADEFKTTVDRADQLQAFQSNDEHTAQLDAALLARKLCDMIAVTDLGDSMSQRAIKLLRHRIEQLLVIRDRTPEIDENTMFQMDNPANAAEAILLLGGEVPKTLRETSAPISPYFRDLIPTYEFLNTERRNSQRASASSEWFPYQTLQAVSELMTQAKNTQPWHQNSHTRAIKGRPSIVLDFVKHASDPSGRLIGLVDFDDDLAASLRRHSRWRKEVEDSIEQSTKRVEISFALRIIDLIEEKEQSNARLVEWLGNGDAVRTRLAIDRLSAPGRTGAPTFPDELAPAVAQAIERLASSGPLEPDDLHHLQAVSKHSTHALQYARQYVERKLKSEQFEMTRTDSGFRGATQILLEHPDEIAKMEAELRSALGSYTRPRNSRAPLNDKDLIHRLLRAISSP